MTARILTRSKTTLVGVAASLSVAALALSGGFSSRSADAAEVPYLPYTSTSYFQSTHGPVDTATTTSMQAYLRSVVGTSEQPTNYIKLNGLGTNKWGTPFAIAAVTDPIWKLTGSVPSAVSILATRGFHAPADFGSKLTGTSDSPFVVLDRGYGISVWGANAVANTTNHTINVSAAGYFAHASNGLDKRRTTGVGPFAGSNSTVNFLSRGRIPDSLVVRSDVVRAAIANNAGLGYVTECFWPETDSAAGVKFPMVGAESGKNGWGAEGQRVGINPNVDLTTLGLSPAALTIAKSLQTNGCYIGDNAGSGGGSIKMEQQSASYNPWAGLVINQNSLAPLTWDKWVAFQY